MGKESHLFQVRHRKWASDWTATQDAETLESRAVPVQAPSARLGQVCEEARRRLVRNDESILLEAHLRPFWNCEGRP